MRSGIRERTHWLLGYGIPRATLKLLARIGDPFARLIIDSKHPENAERLDGHLIKQGQAIYLLAGGANRDPNVFDRPDDFDVSRANAREHLGFGTGIHTCLGAALTEAAEEEHRRFSVQANPSTPTR